uniref:UDP-N-acetylenolpyruvoylglucosamine reductase n=1 Tax=Dictyoglomus thermophilum TaxID=14 RepID=A0A7C3MIE9_DICTH
MNIINNEKLKSRILSQHDLAPYTSFKIGGKADLFIIPYSWDELIYILSELKEKEIPTKILGAGTNVLISDEGIKGAVIKICKNLGNVKRIDSLIVEAESGCLISELLYFGWQNELGGLEFLMGIPGTIGGAVTGNAGAWRKAIGDYIEGLYVIDNSLSVKYIDKKDLHFSYRNSNIPKEYIVKSVLVRFEKKDKDISIEQAKKYLKERSKRLPKYPSAGSVFKNPPQGPAGVFIERLGLKGKRIGDAMVSYEHANVIINLGHAKYKDVISLISLIKEEVKKEYGIELEPEIRIW